jgi:SAM-dependent methyltransferase
VKCSKIVDKGYRKARSVGFSAYDVNSVFRRYPRQRALEEKNLQARTFAEAFDYYQAAVYDREVLSEAVAELVVRRKCSSVFDCSCGTGLPALDLRARGFSVECSDADSEMLGEFRRNARERGLSDECSQYRWDQLPSLDRQFQYVMCRGNSLVYADSWSSAADAAADEADIERSILGIASVVAPGGFLHVDAPATSALGEVTYPEIDFRGERVVVVERVVSNENHRRWELQISIGIQVLSFSRNSSNLTEVSLERLLRRNGFRSVQQVELRGERSSYVVLIGRKEK